MSYIENTSQILKKEYSERSDLQRPLKRKRSVKSEVQRKPLQLQKCNLSQYLNTAHAFLAPERPRKRYELFQQILEAVRENKKDRIHLLFSHLLKYPGSRCNSNWKVRTSLANERGQELCELIDLMLLDFWTGSTTDREDFRRKLLDIYFETNVKWRTYV